MGLAPVLRGLSIVAGEAAAPAPGNSFHAFAPGLGHELPQEYWAAAPADVERAVGAARGAFDIFRGTAPEVRAGFLEAIAQQLLEMAAPLMETAQAETGLAAGRVRAEFDRTVNQTRLFAQVVRAGDWVEAVIDHGNPARQPVPKPDLRRMLVPLGPAVVFGASNFPLAYSTAGGDTTSALATGCPVIVKGHPLHPGTGELAAIAIARAAEACGLPPGVFSFLHAGGARDVQVGTELVAHPGIRAGGFTGSLAGGMALARIAAGRPDPIPFFAEMGSTNPVFLLPQALHTRGTTIAAALAASLTGSAGQFCTCPGFVFLVRGADADAFVEKLATAAQAVAPQPMLSPRHRQTWSARVGELGAHAGVTPVLPAADDAGSVRAAILRTTLEALRRDPALREECFGPSLIVVDCATPADLAAAAQEVTGSLTATLWADADDGALARTVLPHLIQSAGRVVHDGVPTGVEVCHAMVHSGPFPACSRPDTTSVGPHAMRRWCRPVAFQNFPESLLPAELQAGNPRRILRQVDGAFATEGGVGTSS